jgi:hypothetical protein
MGLKAGIRFPPREGDFSSSTSSRTALNSAQTPIKWIQGDISLGIKRPGSEADHSLPSSAGVKNGGAIPPLPIGIIGVMFN